MNIKSVFDGMTFKKKKLSDKEVFLWTAFENFIISLNNTEFTETFKKIKKDFSEQTENNYFFIKTPKGQTYEINDTTKIIEKAIKEKEFLTIVSARNNKIQNLRPVKIAYFEGFWYLICLLGKKDKLLKYNIKTIKEITTNGKHFNEPKDIGSLLEESLTIWFDKERNIKVKLSVAKKVSKYFKMKQYFPLQQIAEETEDGSLIVECKVSKIQEIIPTVLQWLPNIKVLEPKFIDKKIRNLIQQY